MSEALLFTVFYVSFGSAGLAHLSGIDVRYSSLTGIERIRYEGKVALVAYFWLAIPFLWMGPTPLKIAVGVIAVPLLIGGTVACVGAILVMIGITVLLLVTFVVWLLDLLIWWITESVSEYRAAKSHKPKPKRKPKPRYPLKRKNEWL